MKRREFIRMPALAVAAAAAAGSVPVLAQALSGNSDAADAVLLYLEGSGDAAAGAGRPWRSAARAAAEAPALTQARIVLRDYVRAATSNLAAFDLYATYAAPDGTTQRCHMQGYDHGVTPAKPRGFDAVAGAYLGLTLDRRFFSAAVCRNHDLCLKSEPLAGGLRRGLYALVLDGAQRARGLVYGADAQQPLVDRDGAVAQLDYVLLSVEDLA